MKYTSRLENLERMLLPPTAANGPNVMVILPDDGSGDDLPPHLRGDGNAAALVHVVLDDGSCRSCNARHFDEPPVEPAANAEGMASETADPTFVSGEAARASNTPDNEPADS